VFFLRCEGRREKRPKNNQEKITPKPIKGMSANGRNQHSHKGTKKPKRRVKESAVLKNPWGVRLHECMVVTCSHLKHPKKGGPDRSKQKKKNEGAKRKGSKTGGEVTYKDGGEQSRRCNCRKKKTAAGEQMGDACLSEKINNQREWVEAAITSNQTRREGCTGGKQCRP